MQSFKKAFLLIGFLLWAGVAHALEDVYVVHFILDGVHTQVLHQAIKDGKLPHLKAHFFDQGAIFTKAITTFPTVSSPGYISFATGLNAGHSGVFFLEWFDRTKQKVVGYLTAKDFDRVNQDLINRLALHDAEAEGFYTPTTLFEKLAPAPSAAIYTPIRRGATLVIPKKFPIRALFSGLVAKDGLMLNHLAMEKLTGVFSKSPPKIPRYTLIGLYGTDYYGHAAGPASKEVEMVLIQFDQLFADFLAKLKAREISNKTYLIVSSDHGIHSTGKELKLKEYLWERGLRKPDKIYVSNRGVSSTFIYVAGEEGWEEIPTLYHLRHFPTKRGPIDLIQTLLKNEEIDWIAVRDDFDRVRVYQPGGQGVIANLTMGGKSFYSYIYQGKDPLQLANHPDLASLLDGKPHPANLWFEMTAQTRNPNAVMELSHLFADPRAGDILVAAKGDYGFRKAKAATHGSLTADDMSIPLWISGPTVPHGEFGLAKGADLFPTILNWFGLTTETEPKNQEGTILFAKRPTEAMDPAQLWIVRLERELMDKPPLLKLPNQEELAQNLREMIPPGLQSQVLEACQKEIALRYARWKKLTQMNQKMQKDRNIKWLLAKEANVEFIRLGRMEDIQSILEDR